MKALFYFLFTLPSIDWKAWAWALSVFSAFGAKIAYDISEKIKRHQRITKWYWLETICALFITAVVAIHSRGIIEHNIDSVDGRSVAYAVVGVAGFEVFRILYRVLTNRQFWSSLVRLLLLRWVDALSPKKSSTDEPTS